MLIRGPSRLMSAKRPSIVDQSAAAAAAAAALFNYHHQPVKENNTFRVVSYVGPMLW